MTGTTQPVPFRTTNPDWYPTIFVQYLRNFKQSYCGIHIVRIDAMQTLWDFQVWETTVLLVHEVSTVVKNIKDFDSWRLKTSLRRWIPKIEAPLPLWLARIKRCLRKRGGTRQFWKTSEEKYYKPSHMQLVPASQSFATNERKLMLTIIQHLCARQNCESQLVFVETVWHWPSNLEMKTTLTLMHR